MEQKYVERFWSRVNKNGQNGCWLWTGGNGGKKAYGKFNVWPKTYNAHRVAWELIHGPIPDGMCVLHRCDVPLCVNAVDHLFLGTKADNNIDTMLKGRLYKGPNGKLNLDPLKSTHGPNNYMCKLTTEQVISLRKERADGVSRADLMQKYGVSRSTVDRIVERKTWATV